MSHTKYLSILDRETSLRLKNLGFDYPGCFAYYVGKGEEPFFIDEEVVKAVQLSIGSRISFRAPTLEHVLKWAEDNYGLSFEISGVNTQTGRKTTFNLRFNNSLLTVHQLYDSAIDCLEGAVLTFIDYLERNNEELQKLKKS